MSDITLEQQEHNEFIKASVADGSYFKDARDWYIFRYVFPICERTILFFLVIITSVITYTLVMTIANSFPIKEQVPIIIRPKDQAVYFPVIKQLRDSVELKNVDEAVAKYLLTKYLERREEYNFRKINIQALNNRLNYIKNNSSDQEYKNFQAFLSKDNPQSPIIYFGRDFQRLVNVELVSFKRNDNNNLIGNFIPNQIPTEADIRYSVITKINSKVSSSQKYLTKISFKFSGIDANNKADKNLDFTITSYKTYKVK